MDFILANQVADGRGGHKDFHNHDPATPVRSRQECLTKNSFEHHGKLRADLRLLVGGKNVNDAGDRRSGGVGVQRRKSQVPGLRDAQRGFDGFQVAHLADQYHVWVFAKRGAERIRERMSIGVHLALVDQAPFVVVQKLDGVLDGDHVFFALAVDFVQHGGERSRFTGARWPGDQDQSTRLIAKALHHRGQPKRIESLDVPRNGAEHGADGAALIEAVSAKTRQALQAKRKVQLQVFFEAVLLRVGQHAVGDRKSTRLNSSHGYISYAV